MANELDRILARGGNRGDIENRIDQVLIHRNVDPETVSPAKKSRMVDNVIDLGEVYFDTIRTDPSRYIDRPGATSPSPDQPGGQQEPGTPDQPDIDFRRRVMSRLPWLPESLISEFANAWSETGDFQVALGEVRQSDAYKAHFPGNVRDDGTIRLNERQYMSRREGYRQVLGSYDLNPDAFETQHEGLIAGGVTAAEFNDRLASAQTEILNNLEPVQQAYGEMFGVEPTEQAVMASAINPDMNPITYQRRFQTAQIAGEAQLAGFELARREAEQIAAAGLDQQAARSFYRRAERLLPTLGDLQQRHDDDADPFTLDELEDALIFEDPEQQNLINRLFAAEQASFTPATRTGRSDTGPLGALR